MTLTIDRQSIIAREGGGIKQLHLFDIDAADTRLQRCRTSIYFNLKRIEASLVQPLHCLPIHWVKEVESYVLSSEHTLNEWMLVNVLSLCSSLLSISISIEYTWMDICVEMGSKVCTSEWVSERHCFSVVLFQCFRHGETSMSFLLMFKCLNEKWRGGGACESTSLSIYPSSLLLFII